MNPSEIHVVVRPSEIKRSSNLIVTKSKRHYTFVQPSYIMHKCDNKSLNSLLLLCRHSNGLSASYYMSMVF